MGQRARKKGITNAARRAARAAFVEQDEELAAIAQRVYNAGHELKRDPEAEVLPLSIMAPLVVAAETVAPGACRLAKLPPTEENMREVAAYLVAGFREMAVMLDPDHLRKWQQLAEAGAVALTDETDPG
jgi:hypothetical protein